MFTTSLETPKAPVTHLEVLVLSLFQFTLSFSLPFPYFLFLVTLPIT